MSVPPGSVRARPSDRLRAARYVLLAASLAVIASSAIWQAPAAFATAAIALLVAVVAFAPTPPTAASADDARTRSPVWPDSSMKATLEAFPRPGFILDADAIVRFGNVRAADIFPATRPGDPFTFTFRQPEMADALREAQFGRSGSTNYQEPGSATTAYAVSFAPIRQTTEGVGFVLVMFEDVSDRLAIARMRSDFVANASHELRTPLASLTGFIETLQGPARGDPQATERFLAIMLDQARRMRRLLDDLLSLSRAEMRVHRRPTDRVDLVATLRQVGDALAPLAEESGVSLALDLPEPPVEVIGNRDELIQVFQNLLENGIRYGASGGRIDIALERPREQGSVRVHVQDYGPGIAAEHLPRLTERFYRVDVGASREMKGTGLGLAIVKHILTRHQASLEVNSAPGQGARFSVEFQAAATVAKFTAEEQVISTP